MSDVAYLTPEGLESLKKELNDLKTRGRKETARMIQEAREKGDLSENAEYDAAKEAQGLMEIRIARLEQTLSNARLIDQSKVDKSKVSLSCTVKIKNTRDGKEFTYRIVSDKEADLRSGKISAQSPIGKGIMGKKVGETAEVMTPSGAMKFKILSISV